MDFLAPHLHHILAEAREARSYSFSPTLGSDTQHKEEKFRLRRCHSTGTGVAFEGKVEERMLRDHWECLGTKTLKIFDAWEMW